MKNIYKNIIVILGFLPMTLMAQKAEKGTLVVGVRYFNNNNKTQHLVFKTKSKVDGKFKNIPAIHLSIYITSSTEKENLLGTVTTNDVGDAVLLIPPSAKTEWVKSPNQTFVAISKSTPQFDEAKGELTITKAKLQIDTVEGKIVNARLVAFIDTVWTPIANVEMQIGVKRLDGNLSINETPTFTTDSLGATTAEFKRDSLPGDSKGNLILVASVIDNEVYGNLTAEVTVPWGAKFSHISNFDHRTLFARRGHSPIWLELLAYSIVVAVWGIIIFLILQIAKIKKLGAV
ncbi:MAG: hypothetical protein ACR2IM_00330 [Sediminibacterium sp.]